MRVEGRMYRMGLATVGAIALVALSAAACNDTTAPADGVVYGAGQQLGNGTARSYVELRDGKPTSVGVALSEQALDNLAGGHAGHGNGTTLVLRMPTANGTPFRFITLDWNPMGHEPAGTYDLPHFDFHFYTMSRAERDAMVPTDPQFEQKAANVPAPAFVPVGYIKPPLPAVPQMGVHWIDPTSPEFTGQTFSKTFLFGSWDGKVTFAEPMITKAYLETRPDVTQPLPVAQQYATPGWYPTSYTVRWDAASKQYLIALSGLTQRP